MPRFRIAPHSPLGQNQLASDPNFIRAHLTAAWESKRSKLPQSWDVAVVHEIEGVRNQVIEQTELDYSFMMNSEDGDFYYSNETNQPIPKNAKFICNEATIQPYYNNFFAMEDLQRTRYMNLLFFQWIDQKLIVYGTSLTAEIANTHPETSVGLMKAGADVNKYAPQYGNTPLLLAVIKGINHVSTLCEKKRQREIITFLLNHPAINVNARHLVNGMTALHIACARGDDPDFIAHLISRGARLDTKDLLGKTPLDYLSLTYEELQKLISELTDEESFGYQNCEHKSSIATLPTREKRKINIACLQEIYVDKTSRSNASAGNTNRDSVVMNVLFAALGIGS